MIYSEKGGVLEMLTFASHEQREAEKNFDELARKNEEKRKEFNKNFSNSKASNRYRKNLIDKRLDRFIPDRNK